MGDRGLGGRLPSGRVGPRWSGELLLASDWGAKSEARRGRLTSVVTVFYFRKRLEKIFSCGRGLMELRG